MKRLSLSLTFAAMCFAAGVGVNYLAWCLVDAIPEPEVRLPLIKVCQVHGTVMSLEPVPVKYETGVVLSIHDLEARDMFFPNSNHFGRPKCQPPDALVYYCPSCRSAQARWEKRKGYWNSAEDGPCVWD